MKNPSFMTSFTLLALGLGGLLPLHAQSITATPSSIGNLTATLGSPSPSQSFTLNGSSLTAPIVLQASTPFEVSSDNSSYGLTLNLPKPGGTIQSVYGGDFTTATGKIWNTGNGGQHPNLSAFAAITSNGSVVAWGDSLRGGSLGTAAGSLTSNVTAIVSNSYAFAALKTNGSVVTWGPADSGGNSTSVAGSLSSNVSAVFSTSMAFAALKNDGSVVTWGDAEKGGNSTAVAGSLTSNVTAIYSTGTAFAALKNDGSVVTWGDSSAGGNSTAVAGNLTSNVAAIYSHSNAFAALKSNGSLVTWGAANTGGSQGSVAGNLTSNVTAVFTNAGAFAALKNNGSVVTWGFPSYIANANSVAASLSSNVTTVYSTGSAFAALKNDGSVVTWGDASGGGNSTAVAPSISSNVTTVFSTYSAFAALKNDGSVVTWGDQANGGNSTAVAGSLGSNVTNIYSTAGAFAALKNDGSVVVWGSAASGGNSSAVAAGLTSNVTAVYATQSAFAALKKDGSVVTWGSSGSGGSGGPANIGAAGTLPATLFARIGSSPGQAGPVSGNITLTSPGAPSQAISLGGTVLSPAAISLSGNLSFGQILVGQNATRDFSISNLSSSGPALTVSSIASSNSSFSILGNTSNLTVSPSASQNVTVRFQPGVSGDFSANITVTSNAGNNSLLATGTGAHTRIIALAGNLSFGNATVNSTSNGTLSITNTGSGNLTVNSISYPTGFSGNFSGAIAPGTTQNVTVAFRPAIEGSFSGNITVNSDSTSGTSTIAASGTGVHSRIIALSGNLSFGNATVNSSITRNLSISNSGTGNLSVTGITLPAGFSGNFSGTVAPGATQNVTVDFRPSNAGSFGGNITVNSDATSGTSTIAASGAGVVLSIPAITSVSSANGTVGTPFSYQITASNAPTSFSINGTLPAGLTFNSTSGLISGIPLAAGAGMANVTLGAGNSDGNGTAALAITILHTRIIGLSGNLSFGNATVNSTSNRTLSITNSGTGNLTVNSISYPTDFSGNFSGAIAPGATQNVTVSFRPTSDGSFGGNIAVNSDATSGTSTIATSGNSVHTRIIALSGNLSFGNATVNSTSNRTLSITNSGTGNLTVNSISYPTGFSGNFSGAIAPGATQNVTVAFRPSNEGGFGGNITVSSDATSGTSTISISGNSVHTRIIGLSGNLSFGNATVNSTTNSTLSITNSGSGNLTVNSISYPTGFSGNFSGTIPPGATQNVTVAFRPSNEGGFSGNITVNSNSNSGTSTISVSGLGFHTRIIGLSGNLSFGNATVNSTSIRTLSIANTGTGNLTITGINHPAGFTGNFTGSIAPGATQNVTVSFRPASGGSFGGNITVDSNSTSGTSTIAASGIGLSPLSITGDLSFGNVTVNQTANRTISINNNTSGSITVSVSALPAWLKDNVAGSFTLAGNASRTVAYSFRPVADQTYTSNITFSSSQGNATLAATGIGVHTRIIGLSGNLSFGTIGVNTTSNRTLSIENTGTGNLTVTGISLPGGFSGNWTGTIAPGATRNVTVSFSPPAQQAYGGNITVASNATSGNPAIATTGAGVTPLTVTGDLSFGNVTVNQTANRTISINNNTSGSITVSVSALPAWLKDNVAGSFTLAGNASRTVAYSFRPVADQTYTSNITFSSSQGNATLAATGIGVHTRIIGLSGNLSFGILGANTTANRTLSIENTGTGNLTVTGISMPQSFSGNWTGTIAPGTTRNVTVSFRPTTRGAAGGNITVFSNFTSGSADIPVSGRGVLPPVITPKVERFKDLDIRVGAYFEYYIDTENDDADSYGADPAFYNGSTRNPGLPEGLSLNATMGLISGYPRYPLPLTSNITATNAAGTGRGQLIFNILPGVVTLFGENKSRSLNFGNVPVAATITRNITVENLTNDSITVNGISTSSPSFTGNLSINPLIISKKSSRLVRVNFTPALKIAYDARITVKTSLGDFTIPATGTGDDYSEIKLTGNFSFGNAVVGTPLTSNLNIRNTGDLPFKVSGITYPPGFSGDWSRGTIQPFTSRNVTVTFAPTAHQAYGGDITVNSDATSGNPRVAASGTGIPSRILGLTGNLSFGSVGVNATEVLLLSIRNSGSGELIISNISYPAGFEGTNLATTGPITIASNASWNLPVFFKPTATQFYGGNITLTTDATSGNSTFPISGTGISSPVVSLTGNLSFGSALVNGTLTRNLTIANTGTANLTITGLTYPVGFSGNASGNFTLAPNGSRNVAVTFRPTTAGNFTGNISVNSNTKFGTTSLAVSGAGVPAVTLKVYSTMLDGSFYEENNLGFIGASDRFGRIGVNQTANLTLSFKNNSSAPSTVTIPTLPSWLTLNATGSFTVAGNATRELTATFRPPGETLPNKMPGYSQNITFTPNSGPPITVAAFGSGFHTRIIGFSGNLSFGNVTVNSTLTRNLTISNTGSDTLRVSNITFPSRFSGNSAAFSLAPNATRDLEVTFRPASTGNFTQTIFITSNATSGTSTTRDQNFVATTTITANGTGTR